MKLIEVAQKDKTSFECPTCREPHKIEEDGADAYKTHFTFTNLIELVQLHESEKNKETMRCNNSNDNNPAVQYCGECQCYLCIDCVETHTVMKATRRHKIVPIDEIKKDPKKMVQRRYCSEHDDEELKMYCENTQEVICRDCELDDNHRDKNHTHKLIKNVFHELEATLERMVGVVGEKHEEFEQHARYIEGVMEKSGDNIKRCHNSIDSFFGKYRERLNEYERELHDQVKGLSIEADKHMKGELEAVQVSSTKLETAKNYTQKLLKSGNQVDIAMMSKQTKTRLSDLSNEHWDRKTVQVSQWSFLCNEKDPFLSKIRGGINRSEIAVIGLTQPVVGKNQFKMQLDKGVESSTEPTVTLTRNGERLQNVVVTKDSAHCWNVNYQIPGEGEYEIGVAIDGVEAKNSPFRRIWREKLTKGTAVDRGRDWKWGDQNGGTGNHGIVQGWAGEVGASENWVKVKWRNGRQNNYRWGAEGAFDLMILKMPNLEFFAEELTTSEKAERPK